MLFVSVHCEDEIDREEFIPLHKVDKMVIDEFSTYIMVADKLYDMRWNEETGHPFDSIVDIKASKKIEGELLKSVIKRVVKRLENEDATDFISKEFSIPVVDSQDYFHGLERALTIIREEVASAGSVLEYECEEGEI